MLDAYFAGMDMIIRQNGGAMDSIAGDTLLAIFCRPEQAPADAVRAARKCARRRAAGAHWRAHLGISAGSLDIGIARGEAAIGDLGVSHDSSRAVGDGDERGHAAARIWPAA